MSDESSKCRVCCIESSAPIFHGQIRGRDVAYFECNLCGYVQTEEPTWLDEAYSTVINASDTGIISRNLSNVSLVLATLVLLGRTAGRVVDYAGGYGILVRMLRDIGVDAYWNDPYSENLVARGFEYHQSGADLVTAFEAFEHFLNPGLEMERLLSIAPSVLFTTDMIATPTPKPTEWWYYGLEHGQHIGFFRRRTLQYLAEKSGKRLLTDGVSTHLFSDQKVSYYRWMIYRRLARISPALLATKLRSKTWTDHLLLSDASETKAH